MSTPMATPMSTPATYSILVKCVEVSEVDDEAAPPGPPVVQLNIGTDRKQTAAATKGKKLGDWKFKETAGHVIFTVTGKTSVNIAANVVFKDPKTNGNVVLPGQALIAIADLTKLKLSVPSSLTKCDLIEEDVNYATFYYTYELTPTPAAAVASQPQSQPQSQSQSQPAKVETPAATTVTPAAVAAAGTPAIAGAKADQKAGDAKVAVTPAPTPAAAAAVPATIDTKKVTAPAPLTTVSPEPVAAPSSSSNPAPGRRIKPPEWTRDLTASPHPDAVVRDLKTVEDLNSKIIVRVSSLMVTFDKRGAPPSKAADSTAAEPSILTSTMKLQIHPLPGKQALLRSKPLTDDYSKKIFFDFEKKSASLAMSTGDFRSRLYREGTCPRLQIDVSAAGQNFAGALYLPAAMGAHINQAMVVPLLLQDVTDTPMQASVLVEILSGSHDTPSTEPLTADQIRTAFDATKKYTTPGNCTVTADISGFTGYDGEPSGLRIEASLTASAVKTGLALDKSFSYGTGFAQKCSFSLTSTSPALDMLDLRLFKGLSPEDELGRIVVPLSAIFDCSDAKPKVTLDLLEYKAFLFDEGTSTFRLSNWGIASSLAASNYKAPVYKLPAAAVQTPAPAAAVIPTTEQVVAAAATLSPTLLGPAPPSRNTTPATSGTLVGCIQGFVLRSGRVSMERSDEVTVDATLQPEGLRKAPSPANPLKIFNNDLAATVEFTQGKSFTMPLTWSMQQRQVSHLKIGLSVNIGGKGKPVSIGGATLDLASFVGTSYQAANFLIPIRDRSNTASTDIVQDQDVFGWVLVGLQFTPGRATGSKEAQGDIEAKCASMWTKLTDGTLSLASLALSSVGGVNTLTSSSSSSGGVSATLSGLTAPGSPTKQIQSPPAAPMPAPPPTALQVVLSPLDIPAATANSIMKEGEVVCLQLRVGTDSALVPPGCPVSSAIEIMTAVQDNQLAWAINPALLAAPCSDELDRSLSCILYLYLLRVNPTTGAKKMFAESVIVVPREIIQIGLPFDLSIPARDKDGGKVAVANLSIHTSSLYSVTSDVGPETLDKPQDLTLVIRCDGGNVKDPNWRNAVEPFFECSLVPPPSLTSNRRVLASKLQDRTGFLTAKAIVEDKGDTWGLSCKLTLPAELLPQTPAEESQAKWILAIVCRDAARYGCPEVCWSRFGISWDTLVRGEKFSDFISMTPSMRSENPSAGRVQLSITRSDIDTSFASSLPSVVPAASSIPGTTGIGTVAVWLQSITETRAGNEEAQLALTCSTASSFLPSATDPTGMQLDDSSMAAFAEVFTPIDPTVGKITQAIPVAGGDGEIRLKISTTSSKAAFATSFPIMSSITRGSAQSLTPPSLELMLSDEWEASGGPATGPKRGVKRPPRLSLNAAFVPFVRGFLVVTIGEIKLIDVISQKFPADVARRAAVRAVLGPHSNIYSDPFDLKDAIASSSSSSSDPKNKPTSPSSVATISMPIDTFAAATSNNSVLALSLSLLDLDSASETGSPYCLGSGSLQTAVLYYQAMRAAAGSSTAKAISTTVGLSPMLYSDVDLTDPISKKVVGRVSVSAQFAMTAVSDGVTTWVECGMKQPSSSEQSSTMELTLKQSFKTADADNSGTISSEELLQVLVNGAASKKARLQAKGAANTSSPSPDGVVDLLMSLAGPEFAQNQPADSVNMNDAVNHIFGRLDVDGNGQVSWWVWRRVLTSSLLGRNVASLFCNPKDALCVGLAAAADALRVSKPFTANLALPFVRVNIKQDGAQSAALVEAEAQALEDLPPDLPLAKAVPRLQNMVKSLRLSNNTLQRRLEKAIIESQQLGSSDLSSSIDATPAVDLAAAEALRQEVMRAKQRAQDAESQQQIAIKTLEFEKLRGQQLEMELSKVRRANELSTAQMATQSNAKQVAAQKLQQEIAKHKENLDKINLQKKKKMMAVVLLAMWFRRKVLPYVRNNIRERVKKNLSRQLTGMVKKKKKAKEEKEQNEAATKLKSGIRGMKDRRKVTNMRNEIVDQNNKATKIQAVYRGKRAREFKRKLVLQKVAAAFSDKYKKASVVQRALLRWLNYKRGQKALDWKRQEILRDKEAQERKAAAALEIQAASSGEWQKFEDTKNSLEPAEKPHSKACVGYWMSLVVNDEETDRGLVLSFQRDFRLVTVLFNDGELQSKEGDVLKDIPFDHPKIQWYLEPTMAESIAIAKALSNQRSGSRPSSPVRAQTPAPDTPGFDVCDDDTEATEVELDEIETPPIELAGKGYMVSYYDEADPECESRIGHVVSSDPKNLTISVIFNEQDDPTSPRAETISYNHPNLLWYSDHLFHQKRKQKEARDFAKKFSKVPRPLLSKAKGYIVETISKEPDADLGDMHLGKVISIDKKKRTLTIAFEVEEGDEPDLEEMPYMSKEIAWVEAPVIPKTVEMSSVKRPPLKDAVGYTVEVRHEHDDAEHDDMHIGKVTSIDLKKNTFEVGFELEAPVGGETHDYESFPYQTDLVAWMSVPPVEIVLTPRPPMRKIKQRVTHRDIGEQPTGYGPHLVGRQVDFLVCGDHDHTVEVFAPAVVVAIEDKRKSIVIRLSDAEHEHDTEKLPWKSKDVRWVTLRETMEEVEVPMDAPAPPGVGKKLKDAAEAGDVKTIKAMIAEWNWNDVLSWADPDDQDKTPLHVACEESQLEVVKLLLHKSTHGVQVNKLDATGSTPLQWAAGRGDDKDKLEIIKLLLAQPNVDINKPNIEMCTPLLVALTCNIPAAVKLLLDCPSIDVNSALSDGRNALMIAVVARNAELAPLLLANKSVNVNATQAQGMSALYLASAAENLIMMKLLLAHPSIGPSINAQDALGNTPLIVACALNKAASVAMLTKAPGIDINLATKKGQTALAAASKGGFTECVRALVGVPGIDVLKADVDGKAPLDVAANADIKALIRAIIPKKPEPSPEKAVVPTPAAAPTAVAPPVNPALAVIAPTSAVVPSSGAELPWVLGSASPAPSQTYTPGDGLVVYVDAARFLPDNCSITRVCLKLFTSDKKPFGETISTVSNVTGPAASPLFGLRAELRQGKFTGSETCLLRIDTIDRTTNMPVNVGLTCFKLFTTSDGKQPTDANAPFFISEGNFQLPVHLLIIPNLDMFSDGMLDKTQRIPCASVLVRITKAPPGLNAVAPKPTDLGVIASNYNAGAYFGQSCKPTETDNLCYRARSKEMLTVETAMRPMSLLKGPARGGVILVPEGPDATAPGPALDQWRNSLIALLPAPSDMNSLPSDNTYVAPYYPPSGLAVAIDRLYNLPDTAGGMIRSAKSHAYRVLYSLSTSGFYSDPKISSKEVLYTKTEDLNQNARAPAFLDGLQTLAPAAISAKTFLIIEVRSVKVTQSKTGSATTAIEEATEDTCFWTMMPIAAEAMGAAYVYNGTFQLPLFCGPVPRGEFWSQASPTDGLMARLGKASKTNPKPFKLLTGASVILRVCNSIFKAFYPGAMDPSSKDLSTSFLQSIVNVAADAATGMTIPTFAMYAFDATRYPAGAKTVAMQFSKGVDTKTVSSIINTTVESFINTDTAPATTALAVVPATTAAPAASIAAAATAGGAPATITTNAPASQPFPVDVEHVERPPLTAAIVGHYLEVTANLFDPSADEHDVDLGSVTSYNEAKKTVTIRLEHDAVPRELPWDSSHIDWVKAKGAVAPAIAATTTATAATATNTAFAAKAATTAPSTTTTATTATTTTTTTTTTSAASTAPAKAATPTASSSASTAKASDGKTATDSATTAGKAGASSNAPAPTLAASTTAAAEKVTAIEKPAVKVDNSKPAPASDKTPAATTAAAPADKITTSGKTGTTTGGASTPAQAPVVNTDKAASAKTEASATKTATENAKAAPDKAATGKAAAATGKATTAGGGAATPAQTSASAPAATTTMSATAKSSTPTTAAATLSTSTTAASIATATNTKAATATGQAVASPDEGASSSNTKT